MLFNYEIKIKMSPVIDDFDMKYQEKVITNIILMFVRK